MQFIDSFLNRITMYRLVLYGLMLLVAISFVLSFYALLPFSFSQLVSSYIILFAAGYILNLTFAKIFGAITNFESSAITAHILFLILTPIQTFADAPELLLIVSIAMLSKYILAIRAKHIFNPTAIALFIIGIFGSSAPLWWVGSAWMLPFVAIVGLLVVHKLRRFQLFFSFLFFSLLLVVSKPVLSGADFIESLSTAFLSWPIVFFGTIMLTEPLTNPPTRKLQIMYGVIVGILFGLQFHIGPIFATPELALVLGNIFSYAVSSKQKFFLHLSHKKELAPNVYEFEFQKDELFSFSPGQYLEWTLPEKAPDSRGNRRYFTIASSPTESTLKLGIRFNEPGSSFKKKLFNLQRQTIVAGQLAGDFVMPQDTSKKLVFIAGGIGITPFRSMVKYLLDKKEKRSVILLYANREIEHIVYKELFERAEKEIGMQTKYIITDKNNVPKQWQGLVGRIDAEMLKKVVPDYQERVFYLSGPNAMVTSYKHILSSLGVKYSNIVTDYFPGY